LICQNRTGTGNPVGGQPSELASVGVETVYFIYMHQSCEPWREGNHLQPGNQPLGMEVNLIPKKWAAALRLPPIAAWLFAHG
jgi:hypothetical protein